MYDAAPAGRCAGNRSMTPSDPAPPLVSVICLAYNQEGTIAQTLDSFLRQKTDFPFEIIVNDDASRDATPAIIADYQRRHPQLIRCILQRENQYSKGVRMPPILLAEARAPLIAYCEGDDFWTDPDKLQLQADLLRRRPDVGAVFTDANVLHTRSGVLLRDYDRRTRNRVPTGDVRRELLLCNPYRSCTAMFRAELVRGYEVAAQQLNSRQDDWVMWLTVAASARIEYLARTTATYRVQQESVSHSSSAFKNIRTLRSQRRIAHHFNRLYGGVLPEDVLRRSHRRDALDRCLRLRKWRAAFNRRQSNWELFRSVLLHWAKQVAAKVPSIYRLAPLGRDRAARSHDV
jgi:glycosyltransferase involved in cell wall biosynthesis